MFLLRLSILHMLVGYGIGALLVALIVRGLASMVGIDERYTIIRMLAYITDPFIQPIRRFVGTIWMLDISFLVALFMLFTLQRLLLQSLPYGW